MAGSPRYTIHSPQKEYVASCKYPSDAAALVGLYGPGAEVRIRHCRVVWLEGREEIPALESYDRAGTIILERDL